MAASTVMPRSRLPSRLKLREWAAGYFFAAPFIIGFLAFTAFPMLYSIWLSFHKWDLLSPPRFIGLQNFIKMIGDARANLSLYNSAYYTFIAVPFQLVISFSLALALTQKLKFRDLYRSGFYLPIIVPLVASAVVKASTAVAPRRRYAAGRTARQVSLLRRFVPESAFDRSLRKQMGLPA